MDKATVTKLKSIGNQLQKLSDYQILISDAQRIMRLANDIDHIITEEDT